MKNVQMWLLTLGALSIATAHANPSDQAIEVGVSATVSTPAVQITHADGTLETRKLKLVAAEEPTESHFALDTSIDSSQVAIDPSFESSILDYRSLLMLGFEASTSDLVAAKLIWIADIDAPVTTELAGSIGLNGATAQLGIGTNGGFWIWSAVFGASLRASYHYAWSNLGIGFESGGQYVGVEGALRFIVVETFLGVYRRIDEAANPGQNPWSASGGVRLYLPLNR